MVNKIGATEQAEGLRWLGSPPAEVSVSVEALAGLPQHVLAVVQREHLRELPRRDEPPREQARAARQVEDDLPGETRT